MPWPTWDQAALLVVAMVLVGAVARRVGSDRALRVAHGGEEIALVSFLYMLWRLARELPLVRDEGAEERGRQVWRLQRSLHLPSELVIERWVMARHWLAEACTTFYATANVPVLIGFLVWLYVRHKPYYGRWRNALVITTGFCLVIRFVRVAPPRLLPDLGFFDMSVALNKSVYGPVGTGISDQYAAMPSIHIAWAGVVAFGAWQASRSRWRWLGMVHLALTFLAVVATGNHWWMDGIVALVLLAISLVLDRVGRALFHQARVEEQPAIPPADRHPAPLLEPEPV
ncbi:MAG: phosphatase PAP2 family protein [Acidimicrobiales bacterium]